MSNTNVTYLSDSDEDNNIIIENEEDDFMLNKNNGI